MSLRGYMLNLFAVLLLPATLLRTAHSAEVAQLSFINDVLPVLSKAGCNAGKCHAKPDGQNGFKLSVFAYDPKSDYEQIVRAGHGRRIFPAAPEASLILLKATMAVNHGGGKRFEPGSAMYQLLVNWISQGAPYSLKDEPTLQKIEIAPAEATLARGSATNLVVTAHFSNGSSRNVTHLADYSSTEKEIAEISEDAQVKIGSLTGQAVLIARYQGMVANSLLTIPADKTLPPDFYAGLPTHNQIDALVYAQLQKLGYTPSELCTDAEFIRRATLDAIGLLPTVEQTRAFLSDTSPAKRQSLIRALLEHPNYAHHWSIKFGDLFRPNPVRVSVKSTYLMDIWLRDSFQQNKPYDKLVRELITFEGRSNEYGPAAILRDRREPVDAATWTSQIFLGVRMECAKCHHHPNEKWSQDDFYQFAAFFKDVKHKGRGVAPPINAGSELLYFAPGRTLKHPVSGDTMKPVALAASTTDIPEQLDPREALADWMLSPENPYFARAIVNRIWGEYFGRGIVDPVDDFRSSNLPSNEPLLDWLARDFVAHQFDLKHLMRTIMESRIYQLSSLPNDSNLTDTKNYSRSLRRRLPAEVLLDALTDITGAPQTYEGLPPGSRASEAWNNRLDSEFMDAFGRPNSSADAPCERDRKTSLVQALHMMNSRDLHGKIASDTGRARKLAESKMSPEEIVTDLYLAAYSRPPTDEELSIATQPFKAPEANRRAATEDVMWALLNSAEFVFNH